MFTYLDVIKEPQLYVCFPWFCDRNTFHIFHLLKRERRIAAVEGIFKYDMIPSNLTNLTRLKYKINSILTQKAGYFLFTARQNGLKKVTKAERMLAIKQREALSTIPMGRIERHCTCQNHKLTNKRFTHFWLPSVSPPFQRTKVDLLNALIALITKEGIVNVRRGLLSG